MTTTLQRPTGRRRRGGFTLIELLVVLFIILLISAVALPVVLPAINHRQVSEAARILQGALVGARDRAIHTGQPAGIRLLPDPAFPISWTSNGAINATTSLAFNRIVPIEPAPEYAEGYCIPTLPNVTSYSGATLTTPANATATYPHALLLVESPAHPSSNAMQAPQLNPPTSWFWNVRVGDKIQLNNAGPWYTIVGPMFIGPTPSTYGGQTYTNPEMFVNAGPPLPLSNLTTNIPTFTFKYGANGGSSEGFPVEYLVLVNGQDDNGNGWVDEGFDGVDNDGDSTSSTLQIDEYTCTISKAHGEWESEVWLGSIPALLASGNITQMPYTIRRRPMPSSTAREAALPSDMVIDATTLFGSRERSRLPIDIHVSYSGVVDVLLNPDGTLVPTTTYSSPTSFSMDQAFYHFWLSERQDVTYPSTTATAPPYLPIAQPGGSNASGFSGPFLKGDYAIVSLNARTGQILTSMNPPFFLDPTLGYTNQPTSSAAYNATYPFIQAEQGVNQGP